MLILQNVVGNLRPGEAIRVLEIGRAEEAAQALHQSYVESGSTEVLLKRVAYTSC